jgi:hypothetical protein
MGETVPIIAVVTSAGVSAVTVYATAYRERVQGGWQSREERAIDLRTVLERAAAEFGRAMFVATEADAELKETGKVVAVRRSELLDAQRRIVLALNQIGVRPQRFYSSEHQWRKFSAGIALRMADTVEATMVLMAAGLPIDGLIVIRALYEQVVRYLWVSIDPETHVAEWATTPAPIC